MLKKDFIRLSARTQLVENSPLRRIDPRVKLAIGLSSSLVIMLPLERLVAFMVAYLVFLAWARLLPTAARQVWRLRWLLLVLFILDVWLVNLELAVAITLRLALLAGVFSLLVATTTPRELSLALESLRLPYRFAFSLGLAFQSLGLIEDEWWMIQEAQRARSLEGGGLLAKGNARATRISLLQRLSAWSVLTRRIGDLVALTVPAIVLTTKRAWMITEAAYARGFDSPRRVPYQSLKISARDWICLAGVLLLIAGLFLWR